MRENPLSKCSAWFSLVLPGRRSPGFSNHEARMCCTLELALELALALALTYMALMATNV